MKCVQKLEKCIRQRTKETDECFIHVVPIYDLGWVTNCPGWDFSYSPSFCRHIFDSMLTHTVTEIAYPVLYHHLIKLNTEYHQSFD